VWKQVDIDAEPTEYISAVLCHSLSVADEVVVDAARLTNLVHRSPVLVEHRFRVDEVLNEFPKRHRIVVLRVYAIHTFDHCCKLLPRPAVSANHVHLFLYRQTSRLSLHKQGIQCHRLADSRPTIVLVRFSEITGKQLQLSL